MGKLGMEGWVKIGGWVIIMGKCGMEGISNIRGIGNNYR